MERAKIAIIGAGPAGIATAVEAKSAGLEPVIILEKGNQPCETIHKFYHPGKRVDPVYRKRKIEPEGICRFDTCTKEEFLALIDDYIQRYELDIRFKQEVRNIKKENDCFVVETNQGLVVKAPVVVIAIGIFGRPVKPSYKIPKEIKDRVFFGTQAHLDSSFRKVLVVGGGDSAAETACFLAKKAQVFLSYRRPQFFRINPTNMAHLEKLVQEGKITLLMNTDIQRLEPDPQGIKVIFKDHDPLVVEAVYYCLGGSTPENFLKSIGVKMEGKRAVVNEYGETNIPGLFLAGDLAVEKGSIMSAFNSAHRVVEGIKRHHLARLEREC